MKKYFTLVVLLCGVYFLGESSAHAEATERTKEEIFQNWYTNYLHSFVGDPYEEKPSVNAPYATGSLKQEFLEEGLKAANFSRYLVGLPDDLELDPILVNRAQHGAVVLAANKWITHSPSKPEGMSDEFYQEAKRSTHTSNLGPGDSLSYAVNQFMYDGHSNNYATVGHRKWILNPSLKKIGFGYANSFIAMQVFDTSRVKKVNYNYVAYPSNGYFPIEYMVQSNIPWSIFLNPSIYAPTSPSGVKVTLTRLNDNKVWTFDYTDYKDAPEGKFFAYSAMNGYGSGDSIIFRPPVAAYQAGDSYQVKVTGLQDWTGKYRSIEYKVDFFNLVQSLDINITKPIRVGEEIPYNIVMKTYNGETIDVTQKIPLKISSFDYEEQMMNGTMKVSGPLHGKVTLQACIVTTCVTSEPPYDEEGYINIETIGDSSKTIKGKTIPNFEVEIRTREYLYGPDRIVASGKANHIGEFDIKIPKLRVDQIVVVVLKNSEGKEIEQVIKTVIDNAPSTPPLPDNDDIRIIDDEKKVWTIAFNMAVDEDSVNNETIRVTDSKGEFFEVHVNVKDETTVQVTPVNHYIQGERYTLIITKNVRSKNSKPLMEAVKLDFMLEDAAPISCDSNLDEVVHIPDENLEKQIRDVLLKPVGNITVADMCSIDGLYLNGNDIENLSGIEYAKNLTVLELNMMKLSDISALSGLTNLQYLQLGSNNISDISYLKGLRNLEMLNLNSNQISDISALSELTNLKTLDLGSNKISDISALSELTNLETLYLYHNEISDIGALSWLANLKTLYLYMNKISDISALSELTNLETVDLGHNKLNVESKEIIENLEASGVSISY